MAESIKTLAQLKTLRYLEVINLQATMTSAIKLNAFQQLTGLKIIGPGWSVKPEMVSGLGQLSELTLRNTQVDTASFQQLLTGVPHLETLVLESNRLLKRLSLSKLRSLKVLEISHNTDLVIEAGTLAGLSKLERLIIRNPQLVDLSDVCALTQLQTLVLNGNGRKNGLLLPDCMGRLDQLSELYIENMKLDRLSEQIGSLRRLQQLSISYCGLDSLPSALGQLTALRELTLVGNKLRQLPAIGQLRALQQLNVAYNQLTTLPDDIGQLTQLKRVELNQNKLTQLPSSFSRLTNLRTLNLTDNQLERLPDDIGKLRKLQTLSLTNNQLTVLPTSIGQLDSLSKLIIGKNRLRTLPGSISRLSNLTTLNLGANELTSLPADIGALRQLTELRLAQLPLDELPASICDLQNLHILQVASTRLRLLPENIGALTKLQFVYLTGNELMALPNSIRGWKDVVILALDGNKLEGLPNAIGQLTKLTTLTIRGKENVAGSVGGLHQLPDSLVNCSQLWSLAIQHQPELDADDVFAKAARLKSLTHLIISNCNVSRLPSLDWKSVPWQMLDLANNLLTELPLGILDAPVLQSISLYNNRLPDVLNRHFYGKEDLRVSFVEAGALPLESLPKPNRKVSGAYQQMANQKVYKRDWEGALVDLGKAVDFAPDTIRTYVYVQLAGVHFSQKDYTKALDDYDQAIRYAPQLRKEKTPDTLMASRMIVTCWQQKATILGRMGQYDSALKAIIQAEKLLSVSDNTMQPGLIYTEHGRYLTMMNKLVDADSCYRKAIRAYEKLPYPDPAIRLTIVELSLLTGQYDLAQQAIANLPASDMDFNRFMGYSVLKEYLETCLAVLKNQLSGTQASERLTTYLKKYPSQINGWSFDLFDNWLAKSKLPAEKVTALRQLTDATKERLDKSQ